MSSAIVVINHTGFTPTERQWHYLLGEVARHDAKRINEFVQQKDRERAMSSVLLQAYIIRRCIPSLGEYTIRRTVEVPNTLCCSYPDITQNKPYLALSPIPGFNYNVSHHGDYVGIISHTSLLVGIDIVDIRTRCNWVNTVKDFINMYTKQFTPFEIFNMVNQEDDNDQYTHFFINWALKEAYVKALGVGIGIDLQQVEFSISYLHRSVGDISGTAELCLSNVPQYNWSLDDSHILATARGPINCAEASYRRAAFPVEVEFTPDMLAAPLPLPEELCIRDILTDRQSAEWTKLK